MRSQVVSRILWGGGPGDLLFPQVHIVSRVADPVADLQATTTDDLFFVRPVLRPNADRVIVVGSGSKALRGVR